MYGDTLILADNCILQRAFCKLCSSEIFAESINLLNFFKLLGFLNF